MTAILESPYLGMTARAKVDGMIEHILEDHLLFHQVEYTLSGEGGTSAATYLQNAMVGTITPSANPAPVGDVTLTIAGLDGTTGTIEVYGRKTYNEVDWADTFDLTNGTYVLNVPLADIYWIVVWGDTKVAVLEMEVV